MEPNVITPRAPAANPVLEEALEAIRNGFSPIPIKADGTKAPDGAWKVYTQNAMTEEEARRLFTPQHGIALVSGYGGLEILDIEDKDTFKAFVAQAIERGSAKSLKTMPVTRCPGGGVHFLYRVAEPGTREILAAYADGKCRIEVRGHGHCTVEAPSPAACHPNNRPYERIPGSVSTVPTITMEERNALLDLARTFNEYVKERDVVGYRETTAPYEREGDADSPGNHCNREYDALADLVGHGWQISGRSVEGRTPLTRPDKNPRDGTSATFGLGANGDVFYVFSTNAVPFEADKSYNPFGVYTMLHHDGDFTAAAKAYAAEQGLDRRPTTKRDAHEEIPLDPRAAACSQYAETDAGNAQRLARRLGDHFRYAGSWKNGHYYNGKRWAKDETGAVTRTAIKTAKLIHNEIVMLDGADAKKWRFKFGMKSQELNRINAMATLAQSDERLNATPADFDQQHYLFNVENGTLNLKELASLEDVTGLALHRHNPADMITKMAKVKFDPAATCPVFARFLQDVLPDPDLRLYVQKAVGYALTGDISEHCTFFMIGNGRNGKGTLLDTISGLMGDYARTADPGLLLTKMHDAGGKHAVADLVGARFVTTSELDEGKRFDEAQIKRLTGGDRRKGERKYENMFEYEPTDKIFFAANHRPDIRGLDEGIWSRFRLIPFERFLKPEERDRHLKEKLAAETAGILNWALEGCRLWQKDGLDQASVMLRILGDYRSEMDVVGRFIADRCEVRARAKEASMRLYQAFKDWAEENTEFKLRSRNFHDALIHREFVAPRKSTGGLMYWTGITLRVNSPTLSEVEADLDDEPDTVKADIDDPFAEAPAVAKVPAEDPAQIFLY